MLSDTRLGNRIRRLRNGNRDTQARMAGRLGISASYLNLIENDRRPLTPALLGRLVAAYGVDEQVFLSDAPARLRADLAEIVEDPLYPGPRLDARELTELAATLPEAGRAVLALYRAYLAARSEARGLGDRLASDPFLAAARHRLLTRLTSVRSYSEILRDNVDLAVSRRQRFVDVLVDESEQLTDLVDEVFDFLAADGAQGPAHQDSPAALVADLIQTHNNHFPDLEDQTLASSGPAIDAYLAAAGDLPQPAAALYRQVLGAYVASAETMPYAPFCQAAADLRYDIELLQQRFGTSFEQVSHRLTTLQRPGAEGVPFHFIRVDIAGNVAKSFSASGLHIPRHGGLCPRWNVHLAFLSSGRIDTQVVQLPDGARYLFVAQALSRAPGGQGAPRSHYAVAIGCDISFAPRLVYADGLATDDPAHDVPVGMSCRQCPRRDCAQRAMPPPSET